MLRRLAVRTGSVLGVSVLALTAVAAMPGDAIAGLPGARKLMTRVPYLTDLTKSSVRVSWATRTQSRGVVKFGRPGHCRARTDTARHLGKPITVRGTREYQNSVEITGLAPDTTYCYRVRSGRSKRVDLLGSNPSPRFRTLQRARGTRAFTFDVMGDWGDTTNSGVNDGSINRNQARIGALIARSHAQFLISVGDTAYPGGTQTEYGDLNKKGVNVSAIFGPHYWAVPGQRIPYFSASGNHGRNSVFLRNWPEKSTTARSHGTYGMRHYASVVGAPAGRYPTSYYAFSTGGVRFYVLDASWGDSSTGRATGGVCGHHCAIYHVDHAAHWRTSSAEYRWLKRNLARHPGGIKIALWHFPLYSDNATQPNDRYLDAASGKNSLERLLHDNGVRLVFNGHAHDYQRNVARSGGVVSYVTGGGGAKVQPVGGHGCSGTDAYAIGWSYRTGRGSSCGAAPRPTSDAQVFNFLRVTVHGDEVTVTPINALGQAFDVRTYSFGPFRPAAARQRHGPRMPG
jgi:hypothetical protein